MYRGQEVKKDASNCRPMCAPLTDLDLLLEDEPRADEYFRLCKIDEQKAQEYFDQFKLDYKVKSIQNLDLDPIKVKLMDEKEGEGWTREYADKMETEYKRFLILTTKYEDDAIVPSSEVDKVWHTHILDTKKYMDDCNDLFGSYLHHFPYFGMRDEDDANNLTNSFDRTLELYKAEFGDDLTGYLSKGEQAGSCTGCPGNCSTGCESIKSKSDASQCCTCGAGSCSNPSCGSSSCTGVSGRIKTMNPTLRPTLEARI